MLLPQAGVPVLGGIVPTSVPLLSGNTTLVVNGSGFTAASKITVAGIPLPTVFVSTTQLQTTLLAALFLALGSLSIAVSTPSPGGGTSQALQISVV